MEPSPQTSWGDGTTNRGIEYNTPDDKYARVITEELLPALNKAREAANIVAALEHMLDIAEHRTNALAPPHRLDVAHND